MEKRVSILLVCLAISTLAISTTSKANLLVDPGAEGQVTGAGGIGGWSLFNGMAFSTNFAHSGSWSFNGNGPGGFTVPGDFQTLPASPGQVYTMTAFGLTPVSPAAVPNSWGALQITYFSGTNGTGTNLGTVETTPGNAKVGNHVDSTTPINTWIPLSVTATAPAGTQSMQIFDLVLDQTPINVYFDDYDLELVPEPSTVAMALTGLFGLVAFAKRRRV
jgi:hypothetical protein